MAAVVVLAAAACGKKGPPLAPLLRVPAQVAEFSAARAGDVVYLTALVPATNVGGDAPADLASLEVYAATAEREPALGEEEPAHRGRWCTACPCGARYRRRRLNPRVLRRFRRCRWSRASIRASA